jgi:hypothetical protein
VVRSGPARTELAGIVHESVAAVDVHLAGGRTVRLPTVAGDAYTGRYAGHVRFFAAALPGGARPSQVVLLDGGGRRLLPFDLLASEPPTGRPRTLLTGATPSGRRWRFGALPSARGPCVTVAARLPRRTGDCNTLEPSGRFLFGEAGCALRQAFLYGVLPAGATGMAGRLADGTTVRARLAHAPGLRRPAWLLALPPDGEMTTLVALGRRGAPRGRQALRILPATRQCGYGLLEFLDGDPGDVIRTAVRPPSRPTAAPATRSSP